MVEARAAREVRLGLGGVGVQGVLEDLGGTQTVLYLEDLLTKQALRLALGGEGGLGALPVEVGVTAASQTADLQVDAGADLLLAIIYPRLPAIPEHVLIPPLPERQKDVGVAHLLGQLQHVLALLVGFPDLDLVQGQQHLHHIQVPVEDRPMQGAVAVGVLLAPIGAEVLDHQLADPHIAPAEGQEEGAGGGGIAAVDVDALLAVDEELADVFPLELHRQGKGREAQAVGLVDVGAGEVQEALADLVLVLEDCVVEDVVGVVVGDVGLGTRPSQQLLTDGPVT